MMCVKGYDGESTEDMGAHSRSMVGGGAVKVGQ